MSANGFAKAVAVQVAIAVAVAIIINRVPLLRQLTRGDA